MLSLTTLAWRRKHAACLQGVQLILSVPAPADFQALTTCFSAGLDASLFINANNTGYSHEYVCAVTNADALLSSGFDISAEAALKSPPLDDRQQQALGGIYSRYKRI